MRSGDLPFLLMAFFAKCLRVDEDGPGWGHPCHLDTFLVISSVSSLSFIFLSPLSLCFISATISSISLLPFSWRQHKMTLKGWHVIKPQHNQSESWINITNISYWIFWLKKKTTTKKHFTWSSRYNASVTYFSLIWLIYMGTGKIQASGESVYIVFAFHCINSRKSKYFRNSFPSTGQWRLLSSASADYLCKQLDPDHAQQNVGPDLEPNWHSDGIPERFFWKS